MMVSLNLLPPERLRQMAREGTLVRWRRSLWLVMGVTALAWLGISGISLYLNRQLKQTTAWVKTLETQTDRSEFGTIRRNISQLNSTVTTMNQALTNGRGWAADLSRLLKSLPVNTQLTELSLTDADEVVLVGVSKLRSDFLALDEALSKNPLLKDVQTDTVPSKRENLDYRYTATFKQVETKK